MSAARSALLPLAELPPSRMLTGCEAELPCGLQGQQPSPSSSIGRALRHCRHSGCADSCGESSYCRPCTTSTWMSSSLHTACMKSIASCGRHTRRALTPSAAYAATSFANLARLARSVSVLPSPKMCEKVTRLDGVHSCRYDGIDCMTARQTLKLRDDACYERRAHHEASMSVPRLTLSALLTRKPKVIASMPVAIISAIGMVSGPLSARYQ
eukprot:1000793-Prymnesium_polylepis.1